MDIKIYAIDPVTNIVKFGFTDNPKKIVGREKMIQLFLINLLKTPGTDVAHPDRGGGVFSMVRGNISDDYKEDFFADLIVKVQKVVSEMKEEQADLDISNEEKISRATVLSVEYDDYDETAFIVSIEIIDGSENISLLNVPIAASSVTGG